MKKNLLLCLIILIIIRNIMTREEFKAEMAEKKERAEARINSALQMFADMIIDRMEVIEASNWKQGWTDGEAMIGLPQNVTGRVYTGSNAFLCQLHSMKNNYKVPVYLTFPQLKDLGAFPKKGEKSIPIFKWGFSIHNRETGEKATLEEYDSIPKEERDKKYKVIPYLKIFNEWNIDQTNLEEVNKEKYDALLSKFEAKEIKDDNGMYSNAAIDQMLASQSWVCPIEYTQQNPSALYNKSKDVIIVPRKDQFNISDTPEEIYKDGEEYYSSLIHEMAHSTGHESRLNRLSPDGKFGGEEYAKEELVAELTAAMVGSALGFDSRIRDNNTAYLKSWMSALKKEPKFLLSVMSDVNKASAMVIEHIDEERVKLGEKALLDGNLDGEEEREKNEKEMQKIVNDATQEKESFSAFRESRTFQVLKGIIISAEWNTGNPLHNVSNFQDFKKAFASVTDIDKFEPSYPKADEKDLTLLKTQVAAMSQKELLEAGAYMLPYYHYPHKEGRTLEDIRQSFRRIEKIGKANPGNEQIQKRVEQARSIYNRYEQNVMDQYKSYEISEDEMKIPSIPMPRYTYIEGLPQLEARQQIQKEFNSLESYMKAISLKSGEVSVRYNIDNNMLEAWREVDGNSELFTSRKYDRRMDGISNMDDFVFHLANEDAKAANMPLYSENKENKMMLEYIEKRAFVWSRLNNQLKHPSGEILIFDYVKEKDAIDAFVMSGEGKRKVYSMHFGEGGETILQNYNFVKKELLSMKQFQKKEDPREAVAKEWDSLAEKPTVKMESGDVLPVEYNKEKDTLDVLITNGAGKQEVYSTNYDHDRSIKGNLGYVWEELSNMKQYQAKEVKQETSSKTATDTGDGLNKEPEINDKEDNSVPIEEGKGGLTPKEYFSTLMDSITDGQHDGHTALGIKNISELRDYFKDNYNVSEWVANATDKEIIEAGADMLPNIRYNHKEGRTLYDMTAAYSNINAKYEDVTDDRTRQIAHRIDQAKSIITAYHTNIENAHDENYLFEKESAHKIIPRAEYAASISQEQAATLERPIDESYHYSFARFESSERTKAFDSYRESGDHEALLHLAEIMDVNNLIELNKVRKNAPKTSEDKVLVENSSYAVTYNQQNSTYDLLRKIEKEKVLELIGDINDNDEIKASSDDVQKLAYEDAAQQMAEFAEHEPRFLTMPNREVLDFQYNAESNQIEVGKRISEGMDLQYTFDYDLSSSPEHNLSIVHDDLAGLDEFRMLSVEEIEQREKIALSWRNTDNKLEMPSGDVLTVEYDKEKDTLNVAYTTVDGKPEIYSTKYNHEGSTTKNVRDLWQNFANMKQYQSTKEASPEKENKEKASATQEKKGEVYYYSYAYLQSTDDTQEFDDLQKKGDYKQILQQAQMYDQGDALEQSKTFKNAKKYGNDDILDEDDHYAVVYNNGNGGTYELMRKVTKEEILDDIDRYGLEQDASEDVKKVAYESVAKQFSEIKAQIPAFTMPNNDVLYVQYNQEKNQVEVGHITNIGLMKEHTFDYDVNQTLDANLEAINESLQENEEYQAIEEDEEEAESLDEDNQVKVPREDSNIETDVAGMAKQFVAEGMSMEEAEQKAKSIVEEQQHQEHYDEEKQKDAEQKQQQKKQEEQAKKEEEKKPVNHAALLFAALGLASEKNGVWMNRAQRQPAEFIHSHTPVTAYNSIMMTLNTDANKYKTNVYTFYKSAAENNLPVKRNEESLKFNWVNWNYQNMMNHDDIITQKKYDTLSDEEKSFYAKHASRVEQHIYNVDQTIMNAKDHEAYGNLVKTKGAPFVKAEERTISVLQQYNDYQKKHPDVVVLKKTGDSYEIYGEKASDVAKILNLEIEKKKMDGKKVDLVSFPSQHLDTYLPKIIRAGNRVSINDNLKEKKVSIPVQDNTAILNKAYSTAKAVADQSGMKYERIMVVQDTKYDKVDDKIVVSGMSEKTADENHATLYKANDIYRAVVAAVGSEERLDRSGRNSFLPEDDAKHEKLVQELAAGVLMTRQGLPAILSKESEKLVPYWQRELTENPKMLGVLERDVNNAVETIDSILAKREVDYKAIRGQMPGKILTENPERFSISSSLAKLPSMETKEMVVVLDKKHKTADVILPAGASLQVNNEVPGMNKKRILTALGKMGVKEVSFYNAGGGLSLHESNDYYKGKEVTVSKLKQYELLTQQTVDLKDKFAPKKEVKITTFEALPDDMGRYAFFIKAENEPSFAVYPNKEHVNQFYSSLKSENRAVVHNALAKKYYELGTKHPDARVDVITPRKVNIGDAKIDRICITAKRNDPKQHIIFATVNGERMHAPVSKAQWNKMWLSEDMSDYKQRLAAVIFEPFIKKEVKNDVNQQASEKKDETVKPDSPAPEKEQEEQVEQTSRKGRGIH